MSNDLQAVVEETLKEIKRKTKAAMDAGPSGEIVLTNSEATLVYRLLFERR